ncbi:MAG: hypothetical protein U0791_25660, partial [Gemmataceae bacterium]
EMIPLGRVAWSEPSAELGYAFGPGTWIGLGVLFACLVAAIRLARAHDPARNALIIGCFLLAAGGVTSWAGSFAPQIAAASALRWGLAGFFLAGTILLFAREPIARWAASLGFRAHGDRTAPGPAYFLLAVAATVVAAMAVDLAAIGLQGRRPSGPSEGTVFFSMGWTVSNVTPLLLVVLGLSASAVRERSSGYAFAAGAVFVATTTGGYALSITTSGGSLDAVIQMRLAMLGTGATAAWSLMWLRAVHWVPGGPLLTLQTATGLFGIGMIAVVPLARLAVFIGEPLPSHFREFGQFGWFAFALAAWAALRHWNRQADVREHVLGFTTAVAGIVAACAVQPWDEPGRFASFDTLVGFWAVAGLGLTMAVLTRPGSALGPWILALTAGIVLASLLRPSSDAGFGAVPLLLAGYVLIASVIASTVGRTSEERQWNWVIASHALIALVATGFAIRMVLLEPNIWARFSGPLAILFLGVAAMLLGTACSRLAAPLRYAALAAIAFAFALAGGAIPDPQSPTAWLDRNGWAFVSLATGTLVLCEGIPRRFAASLWALDARRTGVALAAAALGLLPVDRATVAGFRPRRAAHYSNCSKRRATSSILALMVLAVRPARGRPPIPSASRGRSGRAPSTSPRCFLSFSSFTSD